MSETTVTNQAVEGGNEAGTTPSGTEGFKPIATPAELDAFLKDRVARAERKAAEKFADYDDLKAKASRLDQIEAANKSELEKTTEALVAAQAERDTAVTDALRFKVAAAHGISSEDAAMFLTGSDETTLTKQAEKLAAFTKSSGLAPVIPQLGGKTAGAGSTADQFAAAIGAALNR